MALVGFSQLKQPAGGAARELAFAASGTSTSSLSSYTFTIAVPDAVAGREAIICLMSPFNSATSITSVTLYGVTATQEHLLQAGTHPIRASIWRVAIPTGTTGDLVVTLNGTAWNCAVDVMRAVGLGAKNATGTRSYSTGGTTVNNIDVNTNNDDCIVSIAAVKNTTAPTVTWAGNDEVTERTVQGNDRISCAIINSGVVSATPRTITATYPTAVEAMAGISISFA